MPTAVPSIIKKALPFWLQRALAAWRERRARRTGLATRHGALQEREGAFKTSSASVMHTSENGSLSLLVGRYAAVFQSDHATGVGRHVGLVRDHHDGPALSVDAVEYL